MPDIEVKDQEFEEVSGTIASDEPVQREGAARPPSRVERTTDLSAEVLESLEHGQRAAIDAVRRFVETVDRAIPGPGEGPSRPHEVVDSALEMADRLVQTQYEFMRRVIDSAGWAISRRD